MERVTDKGIWMDPYLRSNLDSVCYNLDNDWDFVFIVSGSGLVRVGKTVLALQVGYYVAFEKGTPFGLDNVVFSGEELINVSHRLPKNSVIIYDEARAELDAKKTMARISKVLQDFFAECGVYNHFIILVLPDFFELNRTLAISRSSVLLNVYRLSEKATNKQGKKVVKFLRGKFEYLDAIGKKKLYIEGKKHYNDYDLCNRFKLFNGDFHDFWPIDKEEYLKKKITFLKRTRVDNALVKPRFANWERERNILIKYIHNNMKISNNGIAKIIQEGGGSLDFDGVRKVLHKD